MVPRLTIPRAQKQYSATTVHGELIPPNSANTRPRNAFMSTQVNMNDYDSVHAFVSPRNNHNQTVDKFGTVTLEQDSIMTNTTCYDQNNTSTLNSVMGGAFRTNKKNVTIFMPAEDASARRQVLKTQKRLNSTVHSPRSFHFQGQGENES